jgi:hypothetical protein
MAPFYWTVGLLTIATLLWIASRANGRYGRRKRRVGAARELADENDRLRHVLAHLAVENHELRGTSSRYR